MKLSKRNTLIIAFLCFLICTFSSGTAKAYFGGMYGGLLGGLYGGLYGGLSQLMNPLLGLGGLGTLNSSLGWQSPYGPTGSNQSQTGTQSPSFQTSVPIGISALYSQLFPSLYYPTTSTTGSPDSSSNVSAILPII